MQRIALKVICVLLLTTCASLSPTGFAQAAGAARGDYDVVPPSWLAAPGQSSWAEGQSRDSSLAFVFPSLAPGDASDPTNFTLRGIFLSNNYFHKTVFNWPDHSGPGDTIVLKTVRRGPDLEVSIGPESMMLIRHLTWPEFRSLQTAFSDWLCRHSGCWLLEGCHYRLAESTSQILTIFWRDHVLKDATLRQFSFNYLIDTNPADVPYVGTTAKIKYGGATGISPDNSTMYAARILPGQQIVITWGGDSFYPGESGIFRDSYSRSVPAGQTNLQVIADHGLRFFPVGVCGMRSIGQSTPKPPPQGSPAPPYPQAWKTLLGTDLLPIYNVFDLRNSDLLTRPRVSDAPVTEGTPDPRATCIDDNKQYPKFLFLLTPQAYIKADTGYIAQFENEDRTIASILDVEQAVTPARHFIIVGCDTNKLADLRSEWDAMLERVLLNLDPAHHPGRCGDYVYGVFSGKSFVELRHSYSINGNVESQGAPGLEPLDQALMASHSASLEQEAGPESPPLVELRRSLPRDDGGLQAGAVRIRFHTSMIAALNVVTVLQGDEIHAR